MLHLWFTLRFKHANSGDNFVTTPIKRNQICQGHMDVTTQTHLIIALAELSQLQLNHIQHVPFIHVISQPNTF